MTRPDGDRRLRDAMHALPLPEPTDAEVAEVMRRARTRQARTGRRVAIAVAVMVVALAVLALPPGRSAIASMVGGLQGFFQGGAAPGGGRLPIDVDVLLDDVDPGASRVLVERGDLRLVGYHQARTGWPCLSLGTAVADCASGDRWATRTAGHAVVVLGRTPVASSSEVALWGLAERGVATVDVIDSRGAVLRASLGTNAFLVVIPDGREAKAVVARDVTGVVMERLTITGPACSPGEPCPSGG